MRQGLFRTLRARVFIFFVGLFMLLSLLLLYNNSIAVSMMREEATHGMQDNIISYQKRLADSLHAVEGYLSNLSLNSLDLHLLGSGQPNSFDWFSALYRTKKSFDTALAERSADALFLYCPQNEVYFASQNANTSQTASGSIKRAIIDLAQKSQLITEKNAGLWFPLNVEDQFFFLRVVRIRGNYVGAWVSVAHAISFLAGDEFQNSTLVFVDQDGKTLLPSALRTELPPTDGPYIAPSGERMLMVSQATSFGAMRLAALIPDRELTQRLRSFTLVIVAVSAGLLLLAVLVSMMMRRWIVQPTAKLTAAIGELRRGNFGSSVDTSNELAEFRQVSDAFNEMVQEIHNLKIDIYEERLQKQNVEMQFLKLQTTPHFLVNCLNTAYQLTETSHPELVQKLLQELSHHLRYTLSSGETVRLSEEFRHTENYVMISQIRYPGCIELATDYAPEIADAAVVPLLIVNFVENTIKYEVVAGKVLHIDIKAWIEERGDQATVCIRIWDSGAGFDPAVLPQLRDADAHPPVDRNKHIGIGNVMMRAKYAFPQSSFAFRNRDGAGAQIDIELPYRRVGDEEKSN